MKELFWTKEVSLSSKYQHIKTKIILKFKFTMMMLALNTKSIFLLKNIVGALPIS